MELKNKNLVTRHTIKLVIITVSILLTTNVPHGNCFSTGAPHSDAICRSMVPGHGLEPQTSPLPYTIKVDKTAVEGGEKVTVTLSSTKLPFKGFMVMGRKKDFKKEATPQGKMSEQVQGSGPAMAQLTNCMGKESSSITHHNSDPKREIQFQWEAPNAEGEYVILSSIVESHDIFWTDQPSEVIRVRRNAGLQTTTTPKPDKVVSKEARAELDDVYSGCGSTKGCFGIPTDCVPSKTCSMVVSYALDGDNGHKFQMASEKNNPNANEFVAVGLSKDANMGEDSIFACQEPNGINEYYSTARTPPTKTPSQQAAIITNPIVKTIDGHLFCFFSVKPKQGDLIEIPVKGISYDVTKEKVYILLARGPNSGPDALSYHPSAEDRQASGQTTRLSDKTILGSKSPILIQLHGAFMIMAWLLCASTGMFSARYFKQTHVDTKPCGVMFWFAVHRSCMVLTVLMSLTASILIFVEVGGYTEVPEGAVAEYYHPILGITLTSLAILQVLIAFCRPMPNARNRYIFNWVHWIIGNSAHIIGIACIFLANDLNKTNLQGKAGYWGVLVGFIVFHVCLHVVMSIHTLKADKHMEIQNKKRAVLPGPMKLSGLDAEAPGTGFRSAMLTIYILGAATTASILVYFVVSSLDN